MTESQITLPNFRHVLSKIIMQILSYKILLALSFLIGIDENLPLEDNCLKSVGTPPPHGFKLHRRRSAFFEAVTSFGKSPSPLSSHQSSLKSNGGALEDACIFEEHVKVLENDLKEEDLKPIAHPDIKCDVNEAKNLNISEVNAVSTPSQESKDLLEKTKLTFTKKSIKNKKLLKHSSVGRNEMNEIQSNSTFLEHVFHDLTCEICLHHKN